MSDLVELTEAGEEMPKKPGPKPKKKSQKKTSRSLSIHPDDWKYLVKRADSEAVTISAYVESLIKKDKKRQAS